MTDNQMSDAFRAQARHVAASRVKVRMGWTRQQWIDDAREQFEHIDGSVLDLVNGHVSALLSEIDDLTPRVDAARRDALTEAADDVRDIQYGWTAPQFEDWLRARATEATP